MPTPLKISLKIPQRTNQPIPATREYLINISTYRLELDKVPVTGQISTEQKLYILSDDKALLYGRESPLWLIIFSDNPPCYKKEIIRQNGDYLDVVFYQKHQFGYVYEAKEQKVLKFDAKNFNFKTVMQGALN